MLTIDDHQRILELKRRIDVLQTALNQPGGCLSEDTKTIWKTWQWMLDDLTTELWHLEREDRYW